MSTPALWHDAAAAALSREWPYGNQQRWGHPCQQVVGWDAGRAEANRATHFSTTGHTKPLPLCCRGSRCSEEFGETAAIHLHVFFLSGGTRAAAAEEGHRDPSWWPAAHPQGNHRDPLLWRPAQGIEAARPAETCLKCCPYTLQSDEDGWGQKSKWDSKGNDCVHFSFRQQTCLPVSSTIGNNKQQGSNWPWSAC